MAHRSIPRRRTPPRLRLARPGAAALALLAALGVSPGAVAHGGGLDGRGCHHSSASGGYHCHRGELAGERFRSEAAARRATGSGGARSSAAGAPAYDRALYGDWIDADGDCQDTREEVLIREGRGVRLAADGCEVVAGRWRGPYTGEIYRDDSALHADHVVPLAEAHRSGAAHWSRAKRRRFANSLGNLHVVAGATNMSKGADDPADWLPPQGRCHYVEHWQQVKQRWALSMDRAERRALRRVLAACD